jgi:hypothetical protein
MMIKIKFANFVAFYFTTIHIIRMDFANFRSLSYVLQIIKKIVKLIFQISRLKLYGIKTFDC